MAIKRFHRFILWMFLISLLLVIGCNEKAVTPKDNIYSAYTKAQLDSLTFASLKKIDAYPFYTMTYYGDYGFSNYITPRNKNYSIVAKKSAFNSDRWSCTCFAAMGEKDSMIFGRNFDWYDHIPLFLYTDPPDGFASVSMVDLDYLGFSRNNLPDQGQNNQRLLDTPWLPFDGMNEMGVAIGIMAIDHAEPPYDPKKKTIGEIEVLRLVLDYAKSTEHAVELIQKYNVRMEIPPIHYLIADSNGNSAIIELVGGKMIVMRNTEPWQVSANFIIYGSDAPANVSCWRYNKAYSNLKEADGKLSSVSAMNLLESVSQSSTLWSMVYQMKSGKIEVAVGKEFDDIETFQLQIN